VTVELRALVVEGRRRQGLPDHIQDPVALARIAALLLSQPAEAAEAGEAA
jgi:hypothetical protein